MVVTVSRRNTGVMRKKNSISKILGFYQRKEFCIGEIQNRINLTYTSTERETHTKKMSNFRRFREEKNWGKCPFPEDYFAFFIKWKFSSGFHSSKITVLLQNQVKYNVFQYS